MTRTKSASITPPRTPRLNGVEADARIRAFAHLDGQLLALSDRIHRAVVAGDAPSTFDPWRSAWLALIDDYATVYATYVQEAPEMAVPMT